MASITRAKDSLDLDPRKILGTIGYDVASFSKEQTIFMQGDPAGPVFYIQEGKARHTVASKFGKEATLGILGEGEFFGDGGLAGQPLRVGSVIAVTDCKLLQIEKEVMVLALHEKPAFSDMYVAFLLARDIRYQEDVVDQLFGSTEMRLARVLLQLAHFDTKESPEAVISNVSNESLADMAGTTTERVSSCMNGFIKSGFLGYSGSRLLIHDSLLKVVLHD